MKVLYICGRDLGKNGGAGRVAVEIIKNLKSKKIDIRCLFLYGDRGDLTRGIRDLCAWANVSTKLGKLRGAAVLALLLWRFRPDIIHHHDGTIWSKAVSWLYGNSVVVGHAHTDPPNQSAKVSVKFSNLISRKVFEHLVAVSHSTGLKWISRGYPAKEVSVIYNGVDTGRFFLADERTRHDARLSFGIPSEARVVAIVCRLDNTMKRIDDFLRVLALLPTSWFGLVAGDGPDRKLLLKLSAELGLDDRVQFVGHVAEIESLYHASDVLVCTSQWEPFGLVAVEADACGLPVLCFVDAGGIVEVVAALNGTVVPKRDQAQMAQGVIHAYDEATWNRRRQRSREFTWRVTASKILALYSSLCPRQ